MAQNQPKVPSPPPPPPGDDTPSDSDNDNAITAANAAALLGACAEPPASAGNNPQGHEGGSARNRGRVTIAMDSLELPPVRGAGRYPEGEEAREASGAEGVDDGSAQDQPRGGEAGGCQGTVSPRREPWVKRHRDVVYGLMVSATVISLSVGSWLYFRDHVPEWVKLVNAGLTFVVLVCFWRYSLKKR
ncbi:hypothetical protein ACOMHN_066485 [Nucella lapillus]